VTILRATKWSTNADLIADIASLGYIKQTDHVLDPTYGRGLWWKKFKPDVLVGMDLKMDPTFDFRSMPFTDNVFDVVAFDPPYVSMGGRSTTTMPDFHNRYGLVNAPRTPAELSTYIEDGLRECHRVLKPNGILLVKCMNYISSGKFVDGADRIARFCAVDLDMEKLDEAIHVGTARPQSGKQTHTRANFSYLFIYRKRK
jgi:SAM-dependent methyltransferase